eukprot:284817046_1
MRRSRWNLYFLCMYRKAYTSTTTPAPPLSADSPTTERKCLMSAESLLLALPRPWQLITSCPRCASPAVDGRDFPKTSSHSSTTSTRRIRGGQKMLERFIGGTNTRRGDSSPRLPPPGNVPSGIGNVQFYSHLHAGRTCEKARISIKRRSEYKSTVCLRPRARTDLCVSQVPSYGKAICSGSGDRDCLWGDRGTSNTIPPVGFNISSARDGGTLPQIQARPSLFDSCSCVGLAQGRVESGTGFFDWDCLGHSNERELLQAVRQATSLLAYHCESWPSRVSRHHGVDCLKNSVQDAITFSLSIMRAQAVALWSLRHKKPVPHQVAKKLGQLNKQLTLQMAVGSAESVVFGTGIQFEQRAQREISESGDNRFATARSRKRRYPQSTFRRCPATLATQSKHGLSLLILLQNPRYAIQYLRDDQHRAATCLHCMSRHEESGAESFPCLVGSCAGQLGENLDMRRFSLRERVSEMKTTVFQPLPANVTGADRNDNSIHGSSIFSTLADSPNISNDPLEKSDDDQLVFYDVLLCGYGDLTGLTELFADDNIYGLVRLYASLFYRLQNVRPAVHAISLCRELIELRRTPESAKIAWAPDDHDISKVSPRLFNSPLSNIQRYTYARFLDEVLCKVAAEEIGQDAFEAELLFATGNSSGVQLASLPSLLSAVRLNNQHDTALQIAQLAWTALRDETAAKLLALSAVFRATGCGTVREFAEQLVKERRTANRDLLRETLTMPHTDHSVRFSLRETTGALASKSCAMIWSGAWGGTWDRILVGSWMWKSFRYTFEKCKVQDMRNILQIALETISRNTKRPHGKDDSGRSRGEKDWGQIGSSPKEWHRVLRYRDSLVKVICPTLTKNTKSILIEEFNNGGMTRYDNKECVAKDQSQMYNTEMYVCVSQQRRKTEESQNVGVGYGHLFYIDSFLILLELNVIFARLSSYVHLIDLGVLGQLSLRLKHSGFIRIVLQDNIPFRILVVPQRYKHDVSCIYPNLLSHLPSKPKRSDWRAAVPDVTQTFDSVETMGFSPVAEHFQNLAILNTRFKTMQLLLALLLS